MSMNESQVPVASVNLNNQSVNHEEKVLAKKISNASFLIRIGLIFVFGWAAIFMSISPDKYLHYMPTWVEFLMPRALALHIFSAYEVLLCIWLASGIKTRYSGLLAALTIAALTGFNFSEFSVLFRNVSIFFSALALAAMSKD